MSIIYCSNPSAGKDYNPNTFANTAESLAEHQAEAHEESYTGCVLKTGEHNYYDDSDFYALVWNEEKQRVVEIQYATTRGWTYHNTAVVDATDEVRAKAAAWEAERLVREYTSELVESKLNDLTRPDEGVQVRSLTTRGKNKGIVGTVRWIGVDQYQSTSADRVLRYGIEVEGETGRRYLSQDKIQRIDIPQRLAEATMPTTEETEEIAHAARCRALSTYGRR
jgi:hypothetical protein